MRSDEVRSEVVRGGGVEVMGIVASRLRMVGLAYCLLCFIIVVLLVVLMVVIMVCL